MRVLSSLVLALATAVSASVLEARVCGNNCARALMNPTRSGAADCSALLTSTVRPTKITKTRTSTTSVTATEVVGATATVVKTVTVAVAPAPAPSLAKRMTTTYLPLVMPTYATACSNTDAYSSACSCLGVFASETITTCTPRVWTTTIETETVATTVVTADVDTTTVYVTVVGEPAPTY
ncbi:hypothetical protein DL546_005931 [Coniochaeta pulveracea]|uniref:Extracellular membrane protein CFEM domain-containing protein n=1 Tax=Coniochaeta pulveracea TaxID=177199 RepID=A0A420Y3N0_9PEZI|nr:hypothetical protein DL546_005931 [Coniochaeta pulveracea]